MAPEDDQLLMEALMLFSEDSDDGSGADAQPLTAEPNAPIADGSSRHARPSEAAPGESMVELLQAVSETKPADEKRAQAAAKPRRRRRSSKCTYAARREEVARLRELTSQLESQLHELQESLQVGHPPTTHHHAQEEERLERARAENARLRGLVAAAEARIQEARAQR